MDFLSDPAPFFIWNPPQLINLLDFVWQIFQRLLKRIALNKEPQKQRVNEMEQEEQEDDYINAFDFLNNFWCCHCWDLLLETFYFVLYKTFFKKKTLWPLFFMDGFQLPQGYSHFGEAVYFLPFSSQKDESTSDGWKAESTLEPTSGFKHGTPGLGIQRLWRLHEKSYWCFSTISSCLRHT